MIQLSSDQIAQFDRDGFMTIPRLVDQAALEELRRQYDKCLSGEVDTHGEDLKLGDKIRQIISPNKCMAYFAENPVLDAARYVAGQLLREKQPPFVFDMLIDKPAGNVNPTPWHQDFAYHHQPFVKAGTPITNTSLQFWVALDDVDTSNGCMQFIPANQNGPLKPHYIASGDPANPRRLLATDDIDVNRAVACPLKAGGCTIHMEGTPHFTSGNTTKDRQRRAYIFNYGRHLIPASE